MLPDYAPSKPVEHHRTALYVPNREILVVSLMSQHNLSIEEADLLARSTKKIKEGNQIFSNESSGPISYEDIHEDMANNTIKPSYVAAVKGNKADTENDDDDWSEEDDSSDSEEMAEGEGLHKSKYLEPRIRIVEKRLGNYECPAFFLAEREKKRIAKCWKGGLIVKLLGRNIGFRALENRLRQMWIRKGIFSLIDLSHGYFLVQFTNDEDKEKALTEGPWLIYDHYLIVREWTPGFHPAAQTIDKVIVWVRFSDLPIEYYDPAILTFIGNRIGKTIRIDRNTIRRDRGKYARLCVEVDLSNPLLALFELEDRLYKVEYEGLHMLCLTCGRYGHDMASCKDTEATIAKKRWINQVSNENNNEGNQQNQNSCQPGPWTVVQKPRRQRKQKDNGVGKGNAEQGHNIENNGSRFAILHDEHTHDEQNQEAHNHQPNSSVEPTNHLQGPRDKNAGVKERGRKDNAKNSDTGHAGDKRGGKEVMSEHNGNKGASVGSTVRREIRGKGTKEGIQVETAPNFVASTSEPNEANYNSAKVFEIKSAPLGVATNRNETQHHYTRPPDSPSIQKEPDSMEINTLDEQAQNHLDSEMEFVPETVLEAQCCDSSAMQF